MSSETGLRSKHFQDMPRYSKSDEDRKTYITSSSFLLPGFTRFLSLSMFAKLNGWTALYECGVR